MTQPEMMKKVATVVAKIQEEEMKAKTEKDKEKVHILTKAEVETVVKAYCDVIFEGLENGEEVPVLKVGKFQVKEVKEREVWKNPQDHSLGKKINPAHKAPKFNFGKASKEATK